MRCPECGDECTDIQTTCACGADLGDARNNAAKPRKRRRKRPKSKSSKYEPIDVNERFNALLDSGYTVSEARDYMLGLEVDAGEVKACAKALRGPVANAQLLQGAGALVVGLLLTVVSYAASGVTDGYYILFTGLMTVGLIRLIQGFRNL